MSNSSLLKEQVGKVLLSDARYKVVRKTYNILKQNNYVALLVGGCVRDLLLGRTPKDYDIATNAIPEVVKKLYPKIIEVGVSFGVCKVVEENETVEITTFRKEGGYQDKRRPDNVEFISSIKEDAQRRDFTINAFYLDIDTFELMDFFDGLSDLKNKIIRAIGNPQERFSEDNLRMMRAVRFATQLGFTIENDTLNAIKKMAKNILNVSWERIREEFKLIITSANRNRGIELLDKVGLLAEILPELTAAKGVPQPPEFHPEGDVFVHSLLTLEKLESTDFILSFTALIHDIGKVPTFQVADRIRFNNHDNVGADMSLIISDRFKLSNKEKGRMEWLIRNHLIFKDIKSMRVSRIKRLFNEIYYPDLELLYKADKLAANGDLTDYEYTVNLRRGMPPEKPQPLIKGQDLINVGLKPSPLFKKILNYILDLQLEGKIKTKSEAIERVKELMKTDFKDLSKVC